MVIYIISDCKKGHLSQTRGLAQALVSCAREQKPDEVHEVHEIDVSHMGFLDKLTYSGAELQLPKPNLILCAGHGTHLAALRLAHVMHCLCMTCMKPSIPTNCFDLCIIPRHDYPEGKSLPSHILLTHGTLNSIHPQPDVEKKETLILIGGPSKEFGWDEDHLLTQLATIARYNVGQMVLTTSRRTPEDFLHLLTPACPSIRIEPVESTPPTWVAEHLACAREVWVTQDSVSMVYEALSSGAPVGIIEMPPHPKRAGKAPSRVNRGLSTLVQEGYVTTFTQWLSSHTLKAGPPLQEADRVARHILTHFPALLS